MSKASATSRHVPGDPDRVVHAQLAVPVEAVPERLALDLGHDVVEEAVGLAGVEEGEDMGVLQLGGGGDLLPLRFASIS